MKVFITRNEFEAIKKHAEEEHPKECCGLLIGKVDKDTEVKMIRRSSNISDSPLRYCINPYDYLDAQREARELGLDIIGVYHSHPDHPPNPSEHDRSLAWDGLIYLILGKGEAKCWLFKDGKFHHLDLFVNYSSA